MNARIMLSAGLIAVLAVTMLAVSMPARAQEANQATQPATCAMCDMSMEQMQTMAKIKDVLQQARSAAESKGADKAVAKIDEAVKLLDQEHMTMHKMMKKHMKTMHPKMMGKKGVECPVCGKMSKTMAREAKIVNAMCPTCGKKIDRYNYPDDLIRDYKGMKVGICPGKCQAQWDALSEAEKAEKLEKAKMPAWKSKKGYEYRNKDDNLKKRRSRW